MQEAFDFNGIEVVPYVEPGSKPGNEWYGRGMWRGTMVIISVFDVPDRDYFSAVVEADKGYMASRYFRISARGRTPEEAFELLRQLVA